MLIFRYKKRIAIFFMLIFIVFILLFVITINYTNNSVFAFNNNYKYIAFTYDDGPSKYTSLLIDLLESNNSSATFFMIGNKMENNIDIVLKVYNSNSEIGSHTYSHKNLTKLNNKEFNYEIDKCDEIFYNITSSHFKYLRPPYDYYEKNIIDTNYYVATWNIDTKDWLYKDIDKIYNVVIKNACDGCIVLMHDIYYETYEASKKLLESLNNMNYKIVSISKLIEKKGYNLSKNEIISLIK